MCRLLETIQVLDGRLVNAVYHNRRFNAARRELFGNEEPADLVGLINIPPANKQGLFRCRVVYGESIHSVEFIPYQYRQIESLKIVLAGELDYHLKYADRRPLEALFALRGTCDDIIIVRNDDCLTDSFAANMVFSDGSKWFTPDTPLLPGTQRERLLETGVISARRITLENFRIFRSAGLINAFWDLTQMPVIEMNQIFV